MKTTCSSNNKSCSEKLVLFKALRLLEFFSLVEKNVKSALKDSYFFLYHKKEKTAYYTSPWGNLYSLETRQEVVMPSPNV